MLEHMDTVEILLQHYGWLGLPVEPAAEENEDTQPPRRETKEDTAVAAAS